MPKLEEQDEVIDKIEIIDRKLFALRHKRSVLIALVRSLLHQLLTARTRVHDLDLSAVESAMKE